MSSILARIQSDAQLHTEVYEYAPRVSLGGILIPSTSQYTHCKQIQGPGPHRITSGFVNRLYPWMGIINIHLLEKTKI